MNNHTELPAIGFGSDADYGTMHTVMTGFCARVWLTSGVVLVAEWLGDGEPWDTTLLKVWRKSEGDYTDEITVPTDDIHRIEVL